MQLPLPTTNLHSVAGVVLAATLFVVGCGTGSTVAGRPGVSPPAPWQPSGPSVAVAANIPTAAQAALPIRQSDLPVGRILFVRDGNLWMWQGGNSRQFSEGGIWSQPSFSPDGKQVAYVHWAGNFSDIFLMAADGTDPRRLTRGQSASLMDNSWAMRPTWSPDGSRLAFISDQASTHNQLWVMSKDGDARRQLTSELTGVLWVDSLSWEPNGNRLAMTAAPDIVSPSHIYLIDIAKGAYARFTDELNGAFDPSFSPDGSTLAYIGRPSGQTTLTVQTLDGSLKATFDRLPFLRSPAWSPDGKTLAFLSAQGGVFEIWMVPVLSDAASITLGEPRQLTRDAAIDPMSGLSWTR
jgi:TolB protein